MMKATRLTGFGRRRHLWTSSFRDYAFEDSRRYHRFHECRYFMPNDNEDCRLHVVT